MVACTGERKQGAREKDRERAEAAASSPFVSDSLGAGIMWGGRRERDGGAKEWGER